MLDYKSGKWAAQIIQAQKDDGSWGDNFHSLSMPISGQPLATEQALVRLHRLGFIKDDAVIKNALSYLRDCLAGKKMIPDRMEMRMDGMIFVNLMLAVWIRRFTCDDALANEVASKWKIFTTAAFQSGEYDPETYITALYDIMKPKYGSVRRTKELLRPDSYYPISLLAGEISEDIEDAYFDYIMNSETGFYYGHDGAITTLPKDFQSKKARAYLSAIEIFCEYPNRYCKDKLSFVIDWLNENRNENGKWDMSAVVKDGLYFPLSDSWRTAEMRELDCTYWIEMIKAALE